MYWWRSFDPAEVLAEFGEIKNLQLHVVRIFLDWETFQPQPDRIDRNALANLEIVLDAAEKYALRVIPTFFCGYMSGISLLPEWALDEKTKSYRHPTLTKGKLSSYSTKNLFEDGLMLEAQKLQARVIATTFSKHPAVYAWDLSNEVDNLAVPRNHQVAWNWLQTLVNEARNADLLHPITCGFHQENLEGEQTTIRISDFIGMTKSLTFRKDPTLDASESGGILLR
jgi:endo-1,4-beta-mannosidase